MEYFQKVILRDHPVVTETNDDLYLLWLMVRSIDAECTKHDAWRRAGFIFPLVADYLVPDVFMLEKISMIKIYNRCLTYTCRGEMEKFFEIVQKNTNNKKYAPLSIEECRCDVHEMMGVEEVRDGRITKLRFNRLVGGHFRLLTWRDEGYLPNAAVQVHDKMYNKDGELVDIPQPPIRNGIRRDFGDEFMNQRIFRSGSSFFEEWRIAFRPMRNTIPTIHQRFIFNYVDAGRPSMSSYFTTARCDFDNGVRNPPDFIQDRPDSYISGSEPATGWMAYGKIKSGKTIPMAKMLGLLKKTRGTNATLGTDLPHPIDIHVLHPDHEDTLPKLLNVPSAREQKVAKKKILRDNKRRGRVAKLRSKKMNHKRRMVGHNRCINRPRKTRVRARLR